MELADAGAKSSPLLYQSGLRRRRQRVFRLRLCANRPTLLTQRAILLSNILLIVEHLADCRTPCSAGGC